MGLTESLLFYLLIGVGVAIAVAMVGLASSRSARVFQSLTAVAFWPLYVPMLLVGASGNEPIASSARRTAEPCDALDVRIAEVEAELDGAWSSLDGWAEGALARERDRIAELRLAWRAQADRIREMDRVLAAVGPTAEATDEAGAGERVSRRNAARRQNLVRLEQVRDRARDDLLATLASVGELVSMIHLAKFTGAPASRAEDLVAQIAAAVEGMSEIATWNDSAPRERREQAVRSAAAT